jgi:hypothetical protein
MKNILITFLILIGTAYANASSVRAMSLEELTEKSEVIFEGEVVSVLTTNNERGRIHTLIVFAVNNVVKGQYSENQLTLRFLGGNYQGKNMTVSDLNYPKLGEKGIYFVESITRRLINPLLGWDQGRYLVEKDESGVERVLTANGQPITAVEKTQSSIEKPYGLFSTDTSNNGANDSSVELSKGTAKNIKLIKSSSLDTAVKKSDFKKIIVEMTGESP